MPTTESTAGLSEHELAELDAFLLSEGCDEETLSVDEVHGFVTALIAGPEEIARDEWLEAAWGEPQFPDDATRERMTQLMLRLYDEVREALESRAPFEPLSVEIEDEKGEQVVVYEGWCYGFMLGMEMQEVDWDALPKEEQGLIAPMAQLALLNNEDEPAMDDEEYASWVELLPGAVTALYVYWHADA